MINKSQRLLIAIVLTLLLASFLIVPTQAQEDQPVVRAVLFYSPTCGFCEEIIQNYLPPLLEQYGDQLKIVAINTSLPKGQELYQSTVEYFQIEAERMGVPTLVIGDVVMVGAGEIPAQFPVMIAEGLANGGTDWPAVPGMVEVVADVKPSSGQSSTETNAPATNDNTPPMLAKFQHDPVGNSISVIVLIFMVVSVIGVVISFTKPVPEKEFWPKWVIPLISVLGMGVAFYLTYVETSGVKAVCGPVGDCNTVQLSPYAVLFGVLPVGLLGLIGYALILAGWALYNFGPKSFRWATAISVWGMAFFGTLFSIYLTFLEPFVIGATCMWCISSAIFQTVIFMAATGPAKRAWQEDEFEDEEDDQTIAEQEEPAEEVAKTPDESAETQAAGAEDKASQEHEEES